MFALLMQSACAYRFTNRYIHPPEGGRRIAIAPIFDSSRVVVPHDVLWYALQNAFASSGHLVLANPAKADFYLQAHVQRASTLEYESDARSALQNPHMFIDPNTNQPRAPDKYLNLHAAEIFSKREKLSFLVSVEIWDLRTRTLLLKGDYSVSSDFNMLTVPSPRESQFIRNEENSELSLIIQANSFAQQVVKDLYTSPFFLSDESEI